MILNNVFTMKITIGNLKYFYDLCQLYGTVYLDSNLNDVVFGYGGVYEKVIV